MKKKQVLNLGKYFIYFLCLLFWIGTILPFLVSAQDTTTVLLGLASIAIVAFGLLIAFVSFFQERFLGEDD